MAAVQTFALIWLVTQHPTEYIKSDAIRPVVDRILGRSLFWSEGDQHKRQRQALAPVFTHTNVRSMDPEIRSDANKLVTALQDFVQTERSELTTAAGKDADAVQINTMSWTARATLNIIGSIGFGYDFQLGTSTEAEEIAKAWQEQVQAGITLPAFIAAMVIRTLPFIMNLPVKAIQAQGEIKTVIRNLGKTLVEQRRLTEGGEDGKDLLSKILKMQDVHGESLDTILDHVSEFNFLSASCICS